jgi:FkbM family methyltransferase
MPPPRLPFLLLPYFRRELPGWGRLYRSAGGFRDELWSGAPTRSIRGKLHGYRMELDLANWSERMTFFLGRFYDLPTQLLLRELLRPGDVVADIGGNIGMITLLAARLVGPTGRVIAFEPNPDASRKLLAAVEANGLAQVVRLEPVAASDEQGEAELSVISKHTGLGTLARVDGDAGAHVSRRHRVRTERADDLLRDRGPVALIKIDVEGFEVRALGGLRETLSRDRPVVAAEVSEEALARAGSSVSRLFELMAGLGYVPFGIGADHRAARLRLEPTAPDDPKLTDNVAWIHPDGPGAIRLGRFVGGRLRPAGSP